MQTAYLEKQKEWVEAQISKEEDYAVNRPQEIAANLSNLNARTNLLNQQGDHLMEQAKHMEAMNNHMAAQQAFMQGQQKHLDAQNLEIEARIRKIEDERNKIISEIETARVHRQGEKIKQLGEMLDALMQMREDGIDIMQNNRRGGKSINPIEAVAQSITRRRYLDDGEEWINRYNRIIENHGGW
jgi:hypothetical protein